MNPPEMSTDPNRRRDRIQARSLDSRESPRALAREDGFTIVEVVVSAMLITMISLAAFGVLQAAGRSTAEERHRAQAYAIAQADQARMRSMRISQLSNYKVTSTVTEDGTPYAVASRAEFVTDSTGTSSCTPGTASADYIAISSTVTWPSMGSRPPANIRSIIAPPNGAIAEDRGALAISVTNAQGDPIPGVGLSGTGAGSFSGETGPTGCAMFGNLPEGNYTMTPTTSTGLVDKDGNAPSPVATSVIGMSTNTVELQYDTPGRIDVSFTTWFGSTLAATSGDAIMVANTGMTQPERFGTAGTFVASIAAEPLFPFPSPDAVYAGSCDTNNPNPSGSTSPTPPPSIKSVNVPAGSPPAATAVQLPALALTVRLGSSGSTPAVGARVTVTDRDCSVNGVAVKRTYTTNALGQLANPGLPWSDYDVCASGGSPSRRVTRTNFAVKSSSANGNALVLYLSGTGSTTGTCP
jgi:Tfp pilus assembly protein PilV